VLDGSRWFEMGLTGVTSGETRIAEGLPSRENAARKRFIASSFQVGSSVGRPAARGQAGGRNGARGFG